MSVSPKTTSVSLHFSFLSLCLSLFPRTVSVHKNTDDHFRLQLASARGLGMRNLRDGDGVGMTWLGFPLFPPLVPPLHTPCDSCVCLYLFYHTNRERTALMCAGRKRKNNKRAKDRIGERSLATRWLPSPLASLLSKCSPSRPTALHSPLDLSNPRRSRPPSLSRGR